MFKICFFILCITMLIFNCLLSCQLCDYSEGYDDYLIIKSGNYTSELDENDYKIITYNSLLKDLRDYDVIFIGEFHTNRFIHNFQKVISNDLILNNQDKYALSFEMFERDIQIYLDKYLSGEISEDEFLKNSRPWHNYQSDYKPLIDLAVKHKLPALASNIPRHIAASFNREGLKYLDTINENEKIYLPKKIHTIDDFPYDTDYYKEKFFNFITQMQSESMLKSMITRNKDMLENLFLAQAIKDDTMAESINLFLLKNDKFKLIHYNGSFHSDYYLGTVERLKALNPNLKIAVISPVIINPSIEHNIEDYLNKGLYILLINE